MRAQLNHSAFISRGSICDVVDARCYDSDRDSYVTQQHTYTHGVLRVMLESQYPFDHNYTHL